MTPNAIGLRQHSSAFETPTTTELGNQPDGSAGLNRDLKPQYSTTYEVGAKGIVTGAVQYDLSLFDTEVRDELIPFQVPNGSGRTYYRNGRTHPPLGWRGRTHGDRRTSHDARVVQLLALPLPRLSDRAGHQRRWNTIPGIPTHQLQVAATYRYRGAYATIEALGKTRRS